MLLFMVRLLILKICEVDNISCRVGLSVLLLIMIDWLVDRICLVGVGIYGRILILMLMMVFCICCVYMCGWFVLRWRFVIFGRFLVMGCFL